MQYSGRIASARTRRGLALLPLLGASVFTVAAYAEPVAFTHMRVIDGTGAKARTGMTMVVDHGQIVLLGV